MDWYKVYKTQYYSNIFKLSFVNAKWHDADHHIHIYVICCSKCLILCIWNGKKTFMFDFMFGV